MDGNAVGASGGKSLYGGRTVADHRQAWHTAGGNSSIVCSPAADIVCPNVRKGGLPCIFRMCVGRLCLAGEPVVVSDPYVIGGDIAGCSAALQEKCNKGWKTSCTEAVYSIYSGNLLAADSGNVVFAEWNNAYLCINSCAIFKKVL